MLFQQNKEALAGRPIGPIDQPLGSPDEVHDIVVARRRREPPIIQGRLDSGIRGNRREDSDHGDHDQGLTGWARRQLGDPVHHRQIVAPMLKALIVGYRPCHVDVTAKIMQANMILAAQTLKLALKNKTALRIAGIRRAQAFAPTTKTANSRSAYKHRSDRG